MTKSTLAGLLELYDDLEVCVRTSKDVVQVVKGTTVVHTVKGRSPMIELVLYEEKLSAPFFG